MLCSCQGKQGDASNRSREPQWGQRGSRLREEARSGLRSQSHHFPYGPIVDKGARRGGGRASSGPGLSDRGVIVTHECRGNASRITSICCTCYMQGPLVSTPEGTDVNTSQTGRCGAREVLWLRGNHTPYISLLRSPEPSVHLPLPPFSSGGGMEAGKGSGARREQPCC